MNCISYVALPASTESSSNGLVGSTASRIKYNNKFSYDSNEYTWRCAPLNLEGLLGWCKGGDQLRGSPIILSRVD